MSGGMATGRWDLLRPGKFGCFPEVPTQHHDEIDELLHIHVVCKSKRFGLLDRNLNFPAVARRPILAHESGNDFMHIFYDGPRPEIPL
jgi:hypothetical protein